MKRLSPILITLAALCLPLVAASKPNIVVIFCDDLGYGDLGCYGHPTIRTPNLDRMAQEGQRWTSFYVGASVCTPSRAALLTGRLPIRNGMMSAKRRVLFPDSAGGLPPSEITIPELLKQAGYATGMIGKWHLGHLPQHLPTKHGFDSYWGIPYSNDMDAQPGFANYREKARTDANHLAPIEQYQVPVIENETVIERPANQHTLTSRYNDKAVDFVRKHRDQPFFLYLAHSLPHIPLYAGKAHLGTSRRGLYGDVIEEIDAGVGKLLETLRELGIEENTLIVFTSDNGPWLPFATHGGSAGLLRNGKGTTWEGGMRVPAIFWWPGTVTPAVRMDIGATMDLLPTFCAFTGIQPPADRKMDGYDLSAVLSGKSSECPRREMFYWRSGELYALRSGPWKMHLVIDDAFSLKSKRRETGMPELYHLDHDPGEQFNVAEHHPEVIARLTALAKQHQAGIDPAEDQMNRQIADKE